MKQKDYLLIGIIVFFSAIVSLVVTKTLFGGGNAVQSAEVVKQITSEFKDPDSRFFNPNSFDPTQLISIGNNQNVDPFNGKKQ